MRRTLIILLVLAGVFTSAAAQNTEIKYLSGTGSDKTVDWDFFCTKGRNSGKWTKIAVPSNWELQGFGTYNYGHDKPLADEQGLYKYKFQVPASWKNKQINIVFEGSMTDTKVMINGVQAGEIHQGAFYRFKYDITKLLKFGGNNLLEVTVNKMSANTSVNQAEREAITGFSVEFSALFSWKLYQLKILSGLLWMHGQMAIFLWKCLPKGLRQMQP